MSPAPVRSGTASAAKFPHAWGYILGVFLMLAGVATAAVLIITAIQGFSDDVRDLRRAVNVDDLELSLEQGEYFVFDEDGAGLGPFDVRVFRRSDGGEIATSSVSDGTTYDVDGLNGRARVAFNVPALDIYRVEVNASLDSVTRFAVGGDVGNERANRVVQGLVLGAVLFILGFVVIIGTLFFHARWRVRHELAGRVTQAREVVGRAAGSDDPAAVLGPDGPAGLASRTRERLDAVRESVNTQPDSGRPPPWRTRTTQQANQVLDSIEKRLDQAEPALTDAATDARLADRIDEALGRVQDRVAAGDSLRSIARDERALAAQTSAELEEQARELRQRVADEVDPFEPPAIGESFDELVEQASADVDAVQAEGAAIGAEFVDTVRADALEAGDGLIAGAAAAATAAVASTADLARTSAQDLAESTLPAPPVLPEPSAPADPEWPVAADPEPAPPAEPELTPEPLLAQEPTAEVAPSFIAPPPAMLGLRRGEAADSSTTEADVEPVAQSSQPFRLSPAPPLRPLSPLVTGGGEEDVLSAAEDLGEVAVSEDDEHEESAEAERSRAGGDSAGISIAPPPPFKPLGRSAVGQDA